MIWKTLSFQRIYECKVTLHMCFFFFSKIFLDLSCLLYLATCLSELIKPNQNKNKLSTMFDNNQFYFYILWNYHVFKRLPIVLDKLMIVNFQSLKILVSKHEVKLLKRIYVVMYLFIYDKSRYKNVFSIHVSIICSIHALLIILIVVDL